ncbi:Ada metal-binding domain-containing protein [Streptomyces sp. NPDC052077]|uniref:Ada metal-binding domain-containing protein n=1 Tax=Streptomyces sp. NPDC052077 TaxID=3154757 RepID=UPI00342F987B
MSRLHRGSGGPDGPRDPAHRAVNGSAAPSAGTGDGAPPGLGSLNVPMPADLALRIMRRAGVPDRAYDRYTLVAGPVTALYVAHGRGSVTGTAPADRYGTPEEFEEAHLRRTGHSALRTARPLPGVAGALRTGRDRMLRYDYGALPPERWRVLEAVRGIPRGQVRPLGWLGREAGLPGASAAELLAAVRANPAPVLIPVHRLGGPDGRPLACGLPPELVDRLRAHEGVDEERLDRFSVEGTRYLGSDTTRIFCYPTCAHARRITERHRVPFASVDAARAAGYRECLSCRPVAA